MPGLGESFQGWMCLNIYIVHTWIDRLGVIFFLGGYKEGSQLTM